MGPRAGLDGQKISSPTGIRSRTVQPVVYIYIAKLVFLKFPLVLCYFLLLQAKYSFHSPVLNVLSLRCSFSIRHRVSHPCKSTSTDNIIVK